MRRLSGGDRMNDFELRSGEVEAAPSPAPQPTLKAPRLRKGQVRNMKYIKEILQKAEGPLSASQIRDRLHRRMLQNKGTARSTPTVNAVGQLLRRKQFMKVATLPGKTGLYVLSGVE